MVYRTAVLSLLTAILTTIIIGGGKYLASLESRAFSTPEMRIRLEAFFQEMNQDGDMRMWFEHITDPTVHMSREAKDSIYVTREELRTLIQNTALDNYDVMRRQNVHERAQEDVNRKMLMTLDLILTKQDKLQMDINNLKATRP